MKHLLASIHRLTWVSLLVTTLISGCSTEEPVSNIPNLRTLSVPEQQVASASNNFSFTIFSQINKEHQSDNIFISPFSISAALSMTANGAQGETQLAIRQVLGNDHLTDDEMNEAYKGLQSFLLELDKKVTIQIANSNWYSKEYSIKNEFRDLLLTYYNAEVKMADFAAPSTVSDINKWIEGNTNGKIKDMLDQIPDDAVMYLINAIYFKADWQYKFDEEKTALAPFYTPNGATDVKMMFSKGTKLSYQYADEFTLIDIPYGNGQYSMTVLMQNEDSDINEIIEGLNNPLFENMVNKADTITAELYLPKFKLEFKEELKDVLTDLGIGIAFSPKADFSNLFEEDLPFAISRVLHQSFLEVNEKGSEAAAATIVEAVVLSSEASGQPKVFVINRPFAFFIREKHSNVILFAGKMLLPSSN
ncbi:serpin family protein [uncultured Imperialibacter sp.]|uniref:serpin family protein n=1 Tax=uncultured Imperialibacter sp. TaxID=1672639 RepID=UPI0030D820C5